MSEVSSRQLNYAVVEFSVEHELLIATTTANRSCKPQDIYLIADILHSAGFATHELEHAELELLAEYSSNNESKTIEIEAHIDAKFAVNMNKNPW